jgi:hypothetical protein
VPLSYWSGQWAEPLMPELVMEPEEEIVSERFEARKHCAEDILKEALKQQKESGSEAKTASLRTNVQYSPSENNNRSSRVG